MTRCSHCLSHHISGRLWKMDSVFQYIWSRYVLIDVILQVIWIVIWIIWIVRIEALCSFRKSFVVYALLPVGLWALCIHSEMLVSSCLHCSLYVCLMFWYTLYDILLCTSLLLLFCNSLHCVALIPFSYWPQYIIHLGPDLP